jgi:hypothetical protein
MTAVTPFNRPEDLPTITTNNRQLREVSDAALAALRKGNDPPQLFDRHGRLVEIVRKSDGKPAIREVSEAALRGHLSRTAKYVQRPSDRAIECNPPIAVVKDILARSPVLWGLPPLEAIVEAPCLRRDGTVLSIEGYDPDSRLYLGDSLNGLGEAIPEKPTDPDVHRALDLIQDVLVDFPFVDESTKTITFAALLTPVCHPAISGPTPLALIDSPSPGTGKGLLAEVISLISTGRSSALYSIPENEAEWRKQLTSIFLEGTTIVVFDNLNGRLESPQLCKALTANTWADRLLSKNRTVELPVHCTWIVSGNNIQLGGDIPRRCYLVRIDAKCPRPEDRTEFRHRNLPQYVLEKRPLLLCALLTLARAWFAAGCPEPSTPRLGSFESWALTIGGILEHAGVYCFLCNRRDMLEQAAIQSQQWEGFLLALYAIHGDRPFRTGAAVSKIEDNAQIPKSHTRLKETLPDSIADAGRNMHHRLGNAFSEKCLRRFGESGVFIEKAGTYQHAIQWRIVLPAK